MINIDDVVKLLLAVSVSFSIVVVAWQLARLIGASVEVVKDVEKTAENFSDGSDMILEDYKRIRNVVDSFSNLFQNISQIKSLLEGLTGILGGDEEVEEAEVKQDKRSSRR